MFLARLVATALVLKLMIFMLEGCLAEPSMILLYIMARISCLFAIRI